MFLTFFLGIIGLGIVVFVHELGHFVAAKLNGIEVEVFSLGWGKKLIGFRKGPTEYRLSIFPVGGYCKMKGEEMFKKALEEKADSFPHEDGSLFSVSPWRRIITYAAGPVFNLFFSIIVLSIVWMAGFSIYTFSNRIVLLSDYPVIFGEQTYAADEAGLKSGDFIRYIDDEPVLYYSDIQTMISQSPGERKKIDIERNGEHLTLFIVPELDRSSGAGRIGVSAWIEPVIENVIPDSSAFLAGLKPGDRIVEVAGVSIEHQLDLYTMLSLSSEKTDISLIRDGQKISLSYIPQYNEEGVLITGFSFSPLVVPSPKKTVFTAAGKGFVETFETLQLTIKSIRILFSGVDIGQAVSGPLRITYFVGEVASESFRQGIGTGFTSLFRFLSLLSVALCFGNLLPIPALDGGLILLSLVEGISRKPVAPKFFYRYQMVGFFFIILILFLTTFSDLSYLFSR